MSSSRITKGGGRKLILCIDGTNDSIEDATRTNVYRTFDSLRDDPESNQVKGYQSGVGTFNSQNFMTKTANFVAPKLDSAFAAFFEDHVCAGYKWLADHYREGDHIYLFGFSRGAHTVRCVAGMVNKVGIVGRKSASDKEGFAVKNNKDGTMEREVPDDFISKVYDIYTDETVIGVEKATKLKKECAVTPSDPNVPIEVVGVWDTVASVGILNSKHPPFATSNQIIRVFRHALSLDEHRARFNEHLWQPNPPKPKESSWGGWLKNTLGFGASSDAKHALNDLLEGYEDRPETDVKEVWFAGHHSDVGGGSVPNDTPHSLGRVSFRWMLREVEASPAVDLLFDNDKLHTYGFYGPGSAALAGNGTVQSNSGEYEDILSPKHDKLESTPAWWVLEYAWFGKNQADADGSWFNKVRWNRGQGRVIQVQPTGDTNLQGGVAKPKIHYSAKLRQEADRSYVPMAHFYLTGRSKPLDLNTPESPDWQNGVDLVTDPLTTKVG